MLARVAESLYWIGRSIERCEHCSRYLKVQYFSTLDTPMSQNKDFTLRSILFMSGSDFSNESILNENEVWQKVIFDPNNPNSILSIIHNTRENARSIRNVISEEFWESINKWYLESKKLEARKFSSGKIFTFSENMNTNIVIIKSRLHHTFLHDDVWQFICLGIYIERALQVLRILRSKISESIILSDNGVNLIILQYQWTMLLHSLEAFSIHKKLYKGLRSKESIFKLVLANEDFPRSLKHTAQKINSHLNRISIHPEGHLEIKEEFNRNLEDCLRFEGFSDTNKMINSIDNAFECISNFHFQIEKLYFH